jgi:hypothetical protein
MMKFKAIEKATGIERAEIHITLDDHDVTAEVFPICYEDEPPYEYKTSQRNWERVMADVNGVNVIGFVRDIASELGGFDAK